MSIIPGRLLSFVECGKVYTSLSLLIIIARNGIFFIHSGLLGKPKIPGNDKLAPLCRLHRNSIQYHPVHLIVCAEEESRLWRSRYARIFRSRRISSGNG